ncbi:MAG: hypothetical protein R2766_11465 [Saprospiraceae bacterium]
MDPFIMLDYNSKYFFEPSDQPRGVGVHPHRVSKPSPPISSIAHNDSSGGGGN